MTVHVSEKAKVLMGQSPPSASCSENGGGLPFIQGNAEFGTRNPAPRLRCSIPTRVAEAGDLLVSVRAPVGGLNQAKEQTVIGRGLSALRFDNDDQSFAWHALTFAAADLNRVAQGSTFVAVSRDDVERLVIPWHGELNSRIATVLDTVDGAIAKAGLMLLKLRQMREGLVHDLMTRGLDENGEVRDPVRHPEQFQDSPLGRIPKEWNVEPLHSFIASAEYGISTALSSQGSLPVLRMNNLAGGEASLNDLKFATSHVPKSLLLRYGDVLFNRTNSYEHVGRTGIWRGQLPVATFASYLVRLNPVLSRLTTEFLNLVLNTPESQQRMRRYATPAVQQVNINPTQLQLMHIAAPKLTAEQDRIVNVTNESVRTIVTETEELAKLMALKCGVMNDLLIGRVRVPESIGVSA